MAESSPPAGVESAACGNLRSLRYIGKEAEIEVRQCFDLEDFAPGKTIKRFRDVQK